MACARLIARTGAWTPRGARSCAGAEGSNPLVSPALPALTPVSRQKLPGSPMSDRLRILLVGASGVLGRAIVAELSPRHDIVSAGSKSGDIRIDIANPASIVAGFKAAGPLDAVACAAGAVNWHPLSAIKPAGAEKTPSGLGVTDKLMGEVIWGWRHATTSTTTARSR